MVSQNLDQLLRAANALSPAEREELLKTLNDQANAALSADTAKSPRQVWAEEMAKKGVRVTAHTDPSPETLDRLRTWRPIEMPGPPLSDDIIRDRR